MRGRTAHVRLLAGAAFERCPPRPHRHHQRQVRGGAQQWLCADSHPWRPTGPYDMGHKWEQRAGHGPSAQPRGAGGDGRGVGRAAEGASARGGQQGPLRWARACHARRAVHLPHAAQLHCLTSRGRTARASCHLLTRGAGASHPRTPSDGCALSRMHAHAALHVSVQGVLEPPSAGESQPLLGMPVSLQPCSHREPYTPHMCITSSV